MTHLSQATTEVIGVSLEGGPSTPVRNALHSLDIADGEEREAVPLLQNSGGHESFRTIEQSAIADGASAKPAHATLWARGLQLWEPVAQEARLQALLAGPLAGNFFLSTVVTLVTVAFVGRNFSVDALAAASISNSVFFTFCRLPLVGLAGALDTKASQAFGAGNLAALPVLFQRCICFMLAHGLPMLLILVFLPQLLRATGQPDALCDEVGPYRYGLIAALPLEVINRPLNRTLVAQRITQPQLYIMVVVVILHVPLCALLMLVLHLGPPAGAWAIAIAGFNTLVLQVCYVAWAGLQDRVWGRPFHAALQGWREFARLAYPAALMDMVESLCWGLIAILAGLLPNGTAAVAAVAVAMAIYGLAFMPILGFMIAASTRVGNALGAGDADFALLCAKVALAFIPALWALNCVLYLDPHVRPLLISIFISDSDSDEALARQLRLCMYVMVVLNLPDGVQMISGGIMQGCGKQMSAVVVNFIGQFVVALPVSLVCAFVFRWGVVGLLLGLVAGVAAQATGYWWLLRSLDWGQLASKAAISAAQEGRAEQQTDEHRPKVEIAGSHP